MDKGMKTRWISLYVENQVGVLSKISGLFSGKSYNLDSLTVGTTEDPTVSRMTIATVSDDETFEQIKKQLNRMVEVIKVIDFTDVFVRMKEILYVKVRKCSPADKVELFQIAETFKARVIDYGKDSLLLDFHSPAFSHIQDDWQVRFPLCHPLSLYEAELPYKTLNCYHKM